MLHQVRILHYFSDKHNHCVLSALIRIREASWFVLFAWKFWLWTLFFWASAPCRGSVFQRSRWTFYLHLQGGWIVSTWMPKWQGRRNCGGYIQLFEGFTAVTDTEGGRRGYACPEPKGTKIFSHPEVCRNVIKLNQHMAQKPKIIFLFYQKPPRRHENLYLYYSIYHITLYSKSAEDGSRVSSRKSCCFIKNFTTDEVQKNKN